jgi:hypothetical protein
MECLRARAHSIQHFHDDERTDCLVLQNGPSCVAKAKPADDNIEAFTAARRKAQSGESDLGYRKQARHQKFVPELDLEDIDAEL